MPRVPISEESRTAAATSTFPKLRITRGGFGRIAVIEQPIQEYVHSFRGPRFVNGQPVYRRDDRDGSQKIETDFMGRPLCVGDPAVLKELGVDPGNCLGCKKARERPSIFRKPEARYAMNILWYNTRPGSWDLAGPSFGAQVVIWPFTAHVFDKLVGLLNIWKDLRTHDLLLKVGEKKSEEDFQTPYSRGEFDIDQQAAWQAYGDQVRSYTLALVEQNKASDEDLIAACGRRIKPDWFADDIALVEQRWEALQRFEQGGASAAAAPMGPGFGAQTLDQGMDQWRQQQAPQGYPQAGAQQAPTPSFGGYQPGPATQPPAQPAAAQAGPVTPDFGAFGGNGQPAQPAQAAPPQQGQPPFQGYPVQSAPVQEALSQPPYGSWGNAQQAPAQPQFQPPPAGPGPAQPPPPGIGSGPFDIAPPAQAGPLAPPPSAPAQQFPSGPPPQAGASTGQQSPPLQPGPTGQPAVGGLGGSAEFLPGSTWNPGPPPAPALPGSQPDTAGETVPFDQLVNPGQ